MSDGVDRRAEIDTETVKSLQLLNGGTAAALSTMLPSVIQQKDLSALSSAMLVAVGICAAGLFCATVHNRLRRKCSLEYSKKHENREPSFSSRFLKKCQTVPGEPRVCTKSIMWMWSSLTCFVIAVGFVVFGGFRVVGHDSSESSACWVLTQIDKEAIRFNACTGVGERYWLPVPALPTSPVHALNQEKSQRKDADETSAVKK